MNKIELYYSKEDINTTIKYGGNNVPYISIDKLEESGLVLNGFSTRAGGVSTGHLSSMNLGYKRNDDSANVTENHKRMADAIGFDYKRIVTSDQTHTTNVRVVKEADCGKGIITERDYADIDGMVTNVSNIPLATYFADCVPLYFLDTNNKAIGLSHSGWRGTVGKIGINTIKAMTQNYGTDPKNVIACVGPSICQDCYEVSSDVADEFKNAFPKVYNDILMDKGNGKYQLDLWKANEYVFLEAGVPMENIVVCNICTCHNKDVLFSHRGHNGMRGNLAAFLMLK